MRPNLSVTPDPVPSSIRPLLERVTARHLWLLSLLVFVVCLSLAAKESLYTDFLYFWFPWAHSTQGLHPWEMYTHLFSTEGGRLASCNYPPFVPYLLTIGEAARRLLAIPPANDQEMVLIKVPFMLAYVAGGPLCYYGLRRRLGESAAKLSSLLYLLCAPLYVNCVVWGQADTLLALFLTACVIALLNDRPILAGALFGLAVATKVQGIIIAPALLVYVGRRYGWRAVVLGALAAIAVFAGLSLPIVLGGGGAGLWKAVAGSVGYYPLRTATAHNPWFLLDTWDCWLHGKPQSVRIDTHLVLGPLSARHLGYLLFGSYLVFVLARLWKEPTPRRLVFALVMCEFAFYMLPTQMHERYIIPAITFAALYALSIRPLRYVYLVFWVTVSVDQYLIVRWTNGLLTTGRTPALESMFAWVGISLAVIYSLFFLWASIAYQRWDGSGGGRVPVDDIADLNRVEPARSSPYYPNDGAVREEAGAISPPSDRGNPLLRTRLLTAAIAAITVGALILRGIYAFRSGIWRDEALFVYVIRFPSVAAILRFLTFHESHPPLFYLLMHGWERITGGRETALFLPPLFFGTAQIPAVYAVGQRVFGKRVGFAAALLAAVSTPLVTVSGLLRPYSFLPFLTLVSSYLLWVAMYGSVHSNKGIRRTWLLWALSVAALLYTHNWAWFVVGAEWSIAALLLLLPTRISRVSTPRAQIARMWLLAQMLVAAMYLPWLSSFLRQIRVAGHGPTIVPLPFLSFLESMSRLLLPLPSDLGTYILLGVLLLFLVLGAVARNGQIHAESRDARSGLVTPRSELPSTSGLILFAGIPLLGFLFAWCANFRTFVLLPRCEAMLLPMALIAFCAVLVYVARKDAYRIAAVAAVTIGMLYGTLLGLDVPKTNVRELAAQVMQKAAPNDLIVVVPEQVASSFNYYYPGKQEQIDFPEHRRVEETAFDHWIDRIGDPSLRNEVYKDLVAAHRAQRRIWLIAITDNLRDGIPQDDAAIPQKLMRSGFIVCVRASQVRDYLFHVYGKPTAVYCPGGGVSEEDQEGMVAFLFDPAKAKP